MARIRTVKPEFWTSEQVVECSLVARLLFIGMWNFCDDGGNHPASAKSIKMQVFPGDESISSADISAMVDELMDAGLVIEYESGSKSYWHVTGWHHQKIEKPNIKHPAFSDSLAVSRRPVVDQSSNGCLPVDPVREGSVRESKGEECSGEDGNSCRDVGFARHADADTSEKEKATAANKATWVAYSAAYKNRYNAEPVRNQQANGIIAKFVKAVGQDDAPLIARYYVNLNNEFYIRKMHDLKMLIGDAQAIRTQWLTNRNVTASSARSMDKAQASLSSVDDYLRQKFGDDYQSVVSEQ